MRLKEEFITHESGGEHITVTAGNNTFNGLIKSNQTAGFIVECLKESVTKEDLIEKIFEKYNAPREQIAKGVEKILHTLYKIGVIDD